MVVCLITVRAAACKHHQQQVLLTSAVSTFRSYAGFGIILLKWLRENISLSTLLTSYGLAAASTHANLSTVVERCEAR
jgi:hypothetical protein